MYTNFVLLLLWNYWTNRDHRVLKLIPCYKFKDSKGKFKNLYIIQLFVFSVLTKKRLESMLKV